MQILKRKPPYFYFLIVTNGIAALKRLSPGSMVLPTPSNTMVESTTFAILGSSITPCLLQTPSTSPRSTPILIPPSVSPRLWERMKRAELRGGEKINADRAWGWRASITFWLLSPACSPAPWGHALSSPPPYLLCAWNLPTMFPMSSANCESRKIAVVKSFRRRVERFGILWHKSEANARQLAAFAPGSPVPCPRTSPSSPYQRSFSPPPFPRS